MRIAADVVVCVEGFSPMGGHERQAVNIARALRQRGVRVALLSRRPLFSTSIYVQELRRAGVPVVARGGVSPGTSGPERADRASVRTAEPPGPGPEARLLEAAWEWERRTIEDGFLGAPVLHEIPLFGKIPVQGRRALAKLGRPVVHTTFGSPPGGLPPPGTPWAVMTTDGSAAGEGARVRFIPTMAWAAPADNRLLASPTRPCVMFAGRVVAAKGVDVLLDAVHLLGPDVQVRVAGDGADLERVRAKASPFGDRACFLGRLSPPELAAEFAKCQAVAVPSLPSELGSEGVPTVVGEALAAGTRVVASRLGGLPYLARQLAGRKVLSLVTPGSVDELARQLQGAVRSWEVTVPAEARKAYDEVLSPSAIAPQYTEAYEEARSRLPPTGAARPEAG